MRILHTSDWHLGKNLELFSRLDEQEEFIEEFIEIVKNNNIDMVIIAGDIYDSSNPPARAEQLFYKALKNISEGGKTPVLVIAGNHDNPERLVAASPLAYEHGVILLGEPKSTALTGTWGNYNSGSNTGFEIIESGEGYLEISINNEKAVVITLPYPSEKRLNEVLSIEMDEEARRKSYSERIGELFQKLSEKYREDTVNLAVSHIYVNGGEESDSERSIQLGGSMAVDIAKLPEKAQYIALGHLHRPQKIHGTKGRIRYSGSPIQYSKSEINYAKCAYIVDVKCAEEAVIEEIKFRNYKPIEVWKCNGAEEAIKKCEENTDRNVWVYLEIKTKDVITHEEIKEMKRLKKDIVEIKPIVEGQQEEYEVGEHFKEKSMNELFKEFYKKERQGLEPSTEIMDLFLSIVQETEAGE